MQRTFPIPLNRIRIGGPKGIAYKYIPRCPACNSSEVNFRAVLVDETDTFAIKPQDFVNDPYKSQRNYKYQEYIFLSCDKCWYTWNSEPTGRWSTRSDRLTSEPYGPFPALLIDEVSRLPIREKQEQHRIKRYETGRFSDGALSEALTQTRVVMITGAGASAPFSFPAAKNLAVSLIRPHN